MLCNGFTMHVDIKSYDTRSEENMDLYMQRVTKVNYNRSFTFSHIASNVWNKVPTEQRQLQKFYF